MKHVAAFVAEAFRGPKTYSAALGGHKNLMLVAVRMGIMKSR